MENKKPFYESKTLWVALVAVVIGGLETYQTGGDWTAIALTCLGIIMGVLRPISTSRLN